MLNAEDFVSQLRREGLEFFTGVPDSLLKDFCAYVDATLPAENHVITANEGNAVALALGRFVGSGKPSVVYLQNSGLGNTINPLTSLADREVYSVPMLLVIGWRGEPGVKDEPQHVKQGRVTPAQLDALEVPYQVLDKDSDLAAVLGPLCATMREQSRPTALLVRAGTLEKYSAAKREQVYDLVREEAIKRVVDNLGDEDLVVATTGHISRELYEHRIATQRGTHRDFLTVGGMGHTASIALGLALSQPERRVVCLDGDGSLLMHMGMLPVIAAQAPRNLLHVVINNGAHDSVGGQPTVGFFCQIPAIAEASGYREARSVSSLLDIDAALTELKGVPGPVLLEIRVKKGARSDLGRPKSSPLENRGTLMKYLGVDEL